MEMRKVNYNLLPRDTMDVIKLVAACTFKPFDQMDHQLFAGVETANPEICYLGNDPEDGMVVIHEVLPDGGDSFYFQAYDGELGSDSSVEFVFYTRSDKKEDARG